MDRKSKFHWKDFFIELIAELMAIFSIIIMLYVTKYYTMQMIIFVIILFVIVLFFQIIDKFYY